jgi:carboxypeptidase family protein
MARGTCVRSREAGWLSALAALFFLAPVTSLGWVPGGETITGHVRGPGGVSVPGATVQLVEVQTGERKVTWTDEAGNYALTGVSPGTYRLEVSLLGFRTDVREPVPVVEGRALQVNLALVLARPDDNASASTPRSAGGSGGPSNLESLPPEARERLNNLAQESAAGGNPAAGMENVRFSDSGASAGAQPEDSAAAEEDDAASSAANSFLLSGSVSRAASPGDEEGQRRQRGEAFRRDRESQGAPGFGGGGGRFEGGGMFFGGGRWGGRPQVNRLRGNIVESYSNSAFDARPYPLNVPQSPRIPSYQEQAGVAVGGPLSIPHVYRGADRTSFFFHYNLQRSRNPFDSFATVPTLAERQGDFSSSVISSGPLAGTVPVIYDPQSNPRTPFAQNRLTRFDPAALALMNYIPLPNLPGSVQNFHLQEALPSSNDRVMGRIGHRISGKDNVNIFYFLNSARSQSVGNFPGLTRNVSVRSQNLNFGETHTFGPHTINNLALNFSRQRNSTLNPFAFQQDIERQLGIQGVSNDPRDWGLPLIGFTNFTGLNDAIPSLTRNQTLRLFDFLLLNRGKHNLRLGGEVRRVQLNTLTDPDARGTFTFSGFTTSDFTAQGFPVPGTGFDFADFLLGLPQATSVRFGTSSNYFRSWVYSGFAQDDWRVNARLTLNLGLRYEYFQPFTEKYGNLSDLAIGPGFSTVGVVTGLAPGPFPDSLLRADSHNLAPRLGLAFRPWTQRHWVLRAGYGIFYDDSVYQRLTANLASQPPFAKASTLLTTPLQVLTLEQGFPQIASNIARNTYAVDPNFRTPYGQTWSFSLEDEIARDLIFSAAYMGTKGTKLDLLLAPNSLPAGRLRVQNALQFQYETSGAASIYHALQVGLRRQFYNGFSMSGNYTFSKSIDDASSVGGAGNIVAQNFLDLQAERGLSVFDVRHRLSLNHTYEFPLGERKRYLNRGGALARVLGDWQISGNAQLQSGTPFTARALGNLSNNSGTGAYGSQRADSTGETVGLPASEQSTLRYFNTEAFNLPAPGQFGNAGRNTIPGPRIIDFNTSLGRFVTISRERGVRATFRVEANNIFNTPSYSGLATVVNATNFGRVTSVRAMRSVNITMRLNF